MFIVMSVGVQTIIMGAYFVFLGIKGAEATQFSDTLILGAVVCGSMMLFMPVTFPVPMGGLLGMYAVFAPIGITLFMLKKDVKLYGFNAPLPLAIGIFAAALILGTVWAFKISEARFRKRKAVTYNPLNAAYNK